MTEPTYIEAGTETSTPKWGAFTVQPACGSDSNGNTVCVSHDVNFRNNMERDNHIANRPAAAKPCELVWFCVEHGIEAI